jgi:hypothetical protein
MHCTITFVLSSGQFQEPHSELRGPGGGLGVVVLLYAQRAHSIIRGHAVFQTPFRPMLPSHTFVDRDIWSRSDRGPQRIVC